MRGKIVSTTYIHILDKHHTYEDQKNNYTERKKSLKSHRKSSSLSHLK